jgi:SsrA-binding protein
VEVSEIPTKKTGGKVIAVNRKARHDYFVEDTFEAGIALFGTEVKSVRAGAVNLKDSYCQIKSGELYAVGVHISPYEKGNIWSRDPLRDKKLLMHKKEILKLGQYVMRDSFTLIPLSLYFSGSRVKMEVGLCRGKKLYDKRESDAKRHAEREIERASKGADKY